MGVTEGGMTRRGFLVLIPGVLFAATTRRGWASGLSAGAQKKHPKPRPGIDASHVVAAKDVHGNAETQRAFELVREIPEVVDGIRCSCGCDGMEGFYSLLSCFEKDGMAQHCEVCQAHAVLAHRLHRKGKTLDQIRAAIDEEFG